MIVAVGALVALSTPVGMYVWVREAAGLSQDARRGECSVVLGEESDPADVSLGGILAIFTGALYMVMILSRRIVDA